MEPDDRIDREGPDVEPLADDLAVDLALRRDVDQDVAAHLGGAGEAPVGGKPFLRAIRGFQVGERGQVAGRRT